jgi:Icc-related predicted phosphoesterase
VQARAEGGGRVFRNAEYLQDKAYEYRGVHFYGSPWTPELVNWAFYLNDDELRDRWELIPDDVEVLITHTPPFGILDRDSSGRNCGCRELQRRLVDLHPRFHCFGHIHASAGTTSINGTTFVNASMVNRRYLIARSPVELDVKERSTT